MNEILTLFIGLTGSIVGFVLVLWIVLRERRKNKFSPFTEKSLRSPGFSLGVQLDEAIFRYIEPFLWLLATPFVYFLLVDQFSSIGSIVFSVLLVVVLVVCCRLIMLRSAEARKTRLGLDGEVYTGQELNYLMREGAYVYHDIPYKYGNIDHVVISTGGVFVVETKAVRKPRGEDGKRQSKVKCENGRLQFPGFSTGYPLKQASRHAEYMRAFLKGKTGEDIPVTPVVALPGWFVESKENAGILIINPKRGNALRGFVNREIIPEARIDILANLIEEIARSVWSKTEMYDPDADKKFGFWLDRKPEERKIE